MAVYQVGNSRYEVPDGLSPEQLNGVLGQLAAREVPTEEFGAASLAEAAGVARAAPVSEEIGQDFLGGIQEAAGNLSETLTTPEEPATGEGTIAAREADVILGVDPSIETRGEILPFGRDAEGRATLAVPQSILAAARGVLLPGQVAKGTPFTIEDAFNTASILAGGPAGRSATGAARVPKKARLEGRQIVRALDSERLRDMADENFTAFRQSGASLAPDDYMTFLASLENKMIRLGAKRDLHPKTTAVMKVLADDIGKTHNANDLVNLRQSIGVAADSLEPRDARLGTIMINALDDFVESLPGTAEWKTARNIYARSRRAATVEKAIVDAGRTASGVENGLRIEFRKILKSPKLSRGFTKAEKDAMDDVVNGDFTTNTLIKIGKLSFGRGAQSGFVGGTTGSTIGALLGGATGAAPGAAIGAVAVPAAARGAQELALARTQRAAEILRALIGGEVPAPTTAARRAPITRGIGGIVAAQQAEEAARRNEGIQRQRELQRILNTITDPET